MRGERAVPVGERCQVCGRQLESHSRPGRDAVYCSSACRQKAYRTRQAGDVDIVALIADVRRRVHTLRPDPPASLLRETSELAVRIRRLRRIAGIAADNTAGSMGNAEPLNPDPIKPPPADSTVPTPTVTTIGVTNPAAPSSLAGTAFAAEIERHRRELQIHCYRMVGSYNEAEDLVQDTMLKAWRSRDEFQGPSTLRAWLYRIATNVCLDFLRRNARKPARYTPVPGLESGNGTPPGYYPWLQPYPDLPADESAPDAVAQASETTELVLLTAIQHLPPRQRAVLILRDMLDLSALETAAALDMTVPAVNSALQRTRPVLRERLPRNRSEWTRPAGTTAEERQVLARYIQVAATGDLAAMREMLAEDVVLTMPPNPFWFVSREAVLNFIRPVFDPTSSTYYGDWKHVPTSANGQPAAAGYVRRPGTTVYRPQVLDVLRIADGTIEEITSFEPHLFPVFGLPMSLPM
jgi:RNA polymerase sigma-70 factor (TIGR02960 family)